MLTILEARIIERMAWVLKWHAMVVSGGYKRRQLFHSDSVVPEEQTPFTDGEKLDDTLNTIDNHIHLMGEMIERLPPEPQQKHCAGCGKIESDCTGQFPICRERRR